MTFAVGSKFGGMSCGQEQYIGADLLYKCALGSLLLFTRHFLIYLALSTMPVFLDLLAGTRNASFRGCAYHFGHSSP